MQNQQENELLQAFRQNPFEAREMILKLTQRSAKRHKEEMDLLLKKLLEPE